MNSGHRNGAFPKEMPDTGDSVVSAGGATGLMLPGVFSAPPEVDEPAPPPPLEDVWEPPELEPEPVPEPLECDVLTVADGLAVALDDDVGVGVAE